MCRAQRHHTQNWNHQWPSERLDGGVAIGSPMVIRALSTHLLDTNLVQKPGSTPSPLDSENLSGVAKQNHRQSIISQQVSQQSTFFGCLKNIKISAKSLVVNVSRMPTAVGEEDDWLVWKIFVWKKVPMLFCHQQTHKQNHQNHQNLIYRNIVLISRSGPHLPDL